MQQSTPTTFTPPVAPARAGRNGASNGNSNGSRRARPPRAPKPRVKKLRLTLILIGLGSLAAISTVFGMLMAVSRDLPSLEDDARYRAAQNSTLQADGDGGQIAKLTGNENRILLKANEISTNVRNAVTAIEDKRFYEHEGVDYRGIARALYQDLRQQRAAQGGSTVTQQFVKTALLAQQNRTVFQKLREAALAYHLERQWTKEKILTQYLNSVYFGNGAYGIESAMRTYFGRGREFTADVRAAQMMEPHEAALLAGIIASPSTFDPVQNPTAARERRDVVLRRMLEENMISATEHATARRQAVPSEDNVNPPRLNSRQPYFSTWVTQQLVDRYDAGPVFGGGLNVKTTLDMDLQERAQEAIAGRIGGFGIGSSLVAIENRTGEVKALVGGADFESKPFNLATNGQRQPGSAFKPFILVEALRQGHKATEVHSSRKKLLPISRKNGDMFEVNNYEDRYFGNISLAAATAQSDNSVYAELGRDLGTRKVARLAQRMGIRTHISTNLAMTLGGLERGVTPLEMAYAYSTIANNGRRVSGTLNGRPFSGPIAIESVKGGGEDAEVDTVKRSWTRVYPESVGIEARRILSGVITQGTGRAARLDEFAAGKTGTTENYGDAWFVGFNDQYTVAVWLGYPDQLRYMRTEYRGRPVAGGTYPAEIWHDFMASAIALRDFRDPGKLDEQGNADGPATTSPGASSKADDAGSDTDAPAAREGSPSPRSRPERTPAPASTPRPSPSPAPAPTQGSGGAVAGDG